MASIFEDKSDKSGFVPEASPDALKELLEGVKPKDKVSASISEAIQNVLDHGEVKSEVVESAKWNFFNEVKDQISALKDGITEEGLDKISTKVNSSESIQTLGSDVIYALNYILKQIKEGDTDFVGFIDNLQTEDISSHPAQIQMFSSICKALKIPGYPLGEINELYSRFNKEDTAVKAGFNQALEHRFSERLRLVRDSLEGQIGLARSKAKENYESYKDRDDAIAEIYGRENDFWRSMTSKKLFELLQIRIALENIVEGRVTLQKVQELNAQLREMS